MQNPHLAKSSGLDYDIAVRDRMQWENIVDSIGKKRGTWRITRTIELRIKSDE
jgi:hypothetical protein